MATALFTFKYTYNDRVVFKDTKDREIKGKVIKKFRDADGTVSYRIYADKYSFTRTREYTVLEAQLRKESPSK